MSLVKDKTIGDADPRKEPASLSMPLSGDEILRTSSIIVSLCLSLNIILEASPFNFRTAPKFDK